jgi:hypothetical protein
VRAELETFGQADHKADLARQAEIPAHALAGLAHGLRRTREQHDLGFHELGRKLVADLQARRQRDARQVVGILVRRRKRERLLETPRHKRDGMAEPREMRRKSRAPGTGADDRKIHELFFNTKNAKIAKKIEQNASIFNRG